MVYDEWHEKNVLQNLIKLKTGNEKPMYPPTVSLICWIQIVGKSNKRRTKQQ